MSTTLRRTFAPLSLVGPLEFINEIAPSLACEQFSISNFPLSAFGLRAKMRLINFPSKSKEVKLYLYHVSNAVAITASNNH